MVHVDELEFATARAAVDVESGEGAEATRVHVLDVFHVDDDALFRGEQVADFVAEMRGVFKGEFAMTFDNGGVLHFIGVDAEGVRHRTRGRSGLR